MPEFVVENHANPKWMVWTGRVLSALPVPLLLFSAYMKFSKAPEVIEGFKEWPEGVLIPIAVAELVSTILYIIPQTAVLGAVLLTGYIGGATAPHVQGGESIIIHIVLGVLFWLGLFFRDARLRALLPWRNL
jgi:hypothetical protein